MEPQAAQVVGQAARGQCVGGVTPNRRASSARRSRLAKPSGEQAEHHQGAEQRLDARVGEAQRGTRCPLTPGALHARNASSPTAQSWLICLDVQQTSVGLKADLPQAGRFCSRLADAEVARVVDGRLRAQGTAFLVVLLDA